MKKSVAIIILVIVFSSFYVITMPMEVEAQNEQDAALYFYGDPLSADGGQLETDAPSDPVGETHDYMGTGGFLIRFNIGKFETEPFCMNSLIDGFVTVYLWVEQRGATPGTIQFNCSILVNGINIGIEFESNEVIIESEPIEIYFEEYIHLPIGTGDTFGIYLGARYKGTGWIFHWAGEDYPSRIVVPAKWADVSISEPEIDYDSETVDIVAEIIHALGPDEITDYLIDIDGPTPANNIVGPSISINGNLITASWTWYWGIDGAEEGAYEITVTVIDNSHNFWDDTEVMDLDFGGGPPPPPPPQYWECIGNITPDPSVDECPSLIQDSNGIYWMAWHSDRSGYWDIWIKNSSDGLNWGNAIQITTDVYSDGFPSLIQDSNGRFWLTWTSDRTGGYFQIWMSYSDDGINWAIPYQISNLYLYNLFSSLIQSDNGEYYVAFSNFNDITFRIDIYVSHSVDGITWSTPIQVTTGFWWNWLPSMIQDDNGDFWIAYESPETDNFDIWITYSNDGINWGSPIQVTTHVDYDEFVSLIQNIDGGYNIAWCSDRNGEAEIFVMSSLNGINWENLEQITEPDGYDKIAPSLIQDFDRTFWIAYEATGPTGYDIYLSYKIINTPPRVSITTPSTEQSGNITIEYRLYDDESNPCEIEVFYTIDDIDYITATPGLGGDGLTNLTSSSNGVDHYFVWNSDADLGGMDVSTVQIWIRPKDKEFGIPKLTNKFHVDNNLPPSVIVQDLGGIQSGDISISYTVFDAESDSITISPKYSLDNIDFINATKGQGGDGTTGLSSSPGGRTYTFIWDSKADLGEMDYETVYFRVTPSDMDVGTSFTTSSFQLDNNAPPEVEIDILSGEKTENVIITYTLFDDESDTLSIVAEFSQDSHNFFLATRASVGDPISGLTSSPEGTQHSFVWASKTDLDGVDDETVYFRITPLDEEIGVPFTTNAFHLDNNEVPEVEITTPTDVQSGEVLITYILKDKESDKSNILAEYSKDGVSFSSAEEGDGGDGKLDLESSLNGNTHTFSWDSKLDLIDTELSTVYFRITPSDSDKGSSGTSFAFTVDNKAPKIISGPSVTELKDTSAIIEWETDEPCNSVINYGKSTPNEFEMSSSSYVTQHIITITELQPETSYLYRVSSCDRCGNGPAESYEELFITEKPENHQPIVMVLSPKQGDKVEGKIQVSGEAVDPDYWDKIEYIEYRIDDGEWSQATGTNQWSFNIDMTSLENGEHVIYVRAYDGEQYSEETKLSIEVHNPSDLGIWLLVAIAAIILIATVIIVAHLVSKARRRTGRVVPTGFEMYEGVGPPPSGGTYEVESEFFQPLK